MVVKSGKFNISAQVALTPSGFLAGDDKGYNAVFKREGAVRIDEILDLSNLAETLAQEKRPKGKRLAIITNASAPSIIAVDSLLKLEGELAAFGEDTLENMRQHFPSLKQVKNPVHLLTDASPAAIIPLSGFASMTRVSMAFWCFMCLISSYNPEKPWRYMRYI